MSYKDPYNFKGKVAVITGGAGSMGSEFGRAFNECGAKVILADKNGEALEKTVNEFKSQGIEMDSVLFDLLDNDSIKSMVDGVVDKFGRIDILCNHAGFNNRKPAVEYSEKEWDDMAGVNLKGLYFTAVEVSRHMAKNRSGQIINTSSVSALRAHKNMSIYVITKAAVVQLTKALAHEWAEHGIRVNAIGPGYVITNQTKAFLSDPAVSRGILSKIPLGKFATVTDIANAVLFLASEKAGHITGHTIYVDGGRLVD